MLLTGVDQQKRDLIMIFDLSFLLNKKKVSQLASQLAELSINAAI